MTPRKPGATELILKQAVPALALMAVEKLIQRKGVKESTATFDKKAEKKRKEVVKSAASVKKNLGRNRGLLSASAAAFAVGIGLLIGAGRKR